MSNDPSVPAHPGAFAATRWTLVLRARGGSYESRAALSDLCAAYYAPVLTFLRRSGHLEDDAREMAHEFFARLLARGGLAGPDPARGRFRSYLLASVKYFLCDHHTHFACKKRGGGVVIESLDDSSALQPVDSSAAPDSAAFDREWALAVMNRAVMTLEAQHEGNRGEQFAALRPWLMGEGIASHAETAARLGISVGAVKTAVHRLRQRFRELLKAEITQTLADPAELNDELRHLCAALSGDM